MVISIAASFVEGGNGLNYDEPASTFYAGLACIDPTVDNRDSNGKKITLKAEQTWQGIAYRELRSKLQDAISGRATEFPWHDPDQP